MYNNNLKQINLIKIKYSHIAQINPTTYTIRNSRDK